MIYRAENLEMAVQTLEDFIAQKEIKRQTKKKVLFPNEEALERYLVTLFEDYNFKQSQRIHKGFGQCSDTLESLFD